MVGHVILECASKEHLVKETKTSKKRTWKGFMLEFVAVAMIRKS